MDTTICPNPDVLADYVLGKVSEADLTGIASHVEACPACQSQLETLDGLSDTVVTCLRRAAAPDEADSDDSLLNEVLARIESFPSESVSDSHGHAHEAVLPQQIGQYRLVEKLGQGGMGAVYKAFHTKLKRTVAVKLLPAYRQRSPQAVSRFHREMEAVGRVDHPNIVRAHDAGEADGQFFLVMEFVEGATLSSLVCSVGPLDVANACEIIRQAAVGLHHAHEHGLVHRDVKPSNLMLTTTGVVKVLDLGLARLQVEACSDGDATASGQIMGSADYMAPEQGSNPRDADARADLYALGCTLYFFLAGRPPFGDQRHSTFLEKVMAHANEDIVPIDQIRPDVPSQLMAVLNRMLAKSPANRFPTAAEVAESLTPFCAGSDLVGLLTDRGANHPIVPIAPNVTDSSGLDSLPKAAEALAVPAAVSTRKVWLIGLGITLLAVAALWYGVGFLPRQSTDMMRSPDQNPKGTDAAQPSTAQDDVQSQGQPKPSGGPQELDSGGKDYIVLHPMQPTVVGVAPDQRVGFPNTLQMVFNSDSPRFLIPKKVAASGAINITRLFLCRWDYVPMVGNAKCFESRQVNLWVPVKDGPYAQAIPDADERTETSTRFQPTCPLPDGVYCLHTEILADSKSPPNFCCPFIVRGYGIPQIEKAGVEVGATDVKLSLVVRNPGLGEFNDGFIVATIQKQDGSRFEFQGRRHINLVPIPAKGQRQVEAIWKTADWKPGIYHFHGHINYEQLWDANTLATFDTDTFAVGGGEKQTKLGASDLSAAAVPAGRKEASEGQDAEMVSAYLRRTTVPESVRTAMLTVVRQHPTETRWSGRIGTQLFGIAAKRLPKEQAAQRAIPAMLELTHMWAVHELLTAKSLLDRYAALGLTDATTLRQAVVEAAGKLQVAGKASTVTHQAATEGNLAISYAIADEAALTAQLLQQDEIEKVRVAYRDVMHRQARELMQRSNWTDALLLWQHLHKRKLVSQQLYLDAASCFQHLNQVPDMLRVLTEAIDAFGKNATPEFLERAGDMALAIDTAQAQTLAEKAYRMASEQLKETISSGREHTATADEER